VHVSLPEGQQETLEAYMEAYKHFRFLDEPLPAAQFDKAALEVRGMALVLSGAIPPYIDLEETATACDLVLANPASLLPSKGTDDGVKLPRNWQEIVERCGRKARWGRGGQREYVSTTFLMRAPSLRRDDADRRGPVLQTYPRSTRTLQRRRRPCWCCPG